jgi:hypothetical protein
MSAIRSFLTTLTAGILLSACGVVGSPSPSPTPSPPPESTATVTLTPSPTSTPLPTPFVQSPQGVTDFVHGASLSHQGDDIFFLLNFSKELDTLATFHVDTVRLDLSWFMPEPGSFEIRSVSDLGSLNDDGLRFFARTVYDHGMDSWLSLHLYYDDWSGGVGWQEEINWDKWEASYTNYILYYAELAESNGIDYLSIVNERPAIISREEFMVELIRNVRRIYSGKIAVNTSVCPGDDYTSIPPEVLKESDIIGLNLYPSPQTPSDTTIEEMSSKLVPSLNRIADYFSGLEYKSLVITEFGVSRLDGSTSMQCTFMLPKTDQEDLQEMANYYQAFASALEQSRLGPMVDGVILHQWNVNERVANGTSLEISLYNDMNPRGNQFALDVITNWYSTLEAFPR